MNKESPKADAPVPQEGTEQALSEAFDQARQKPKPEESSTTETVVDALTDDLVSDAIDIVIAMFE